MPGGGALHSREECAHGSVRRTREIVAHQRTRHASTIRRSRSGGEARVKSRCRAPCREVALDCRRLWLILFRRAGVERWRVNEPPEVIQSRSNRDDVGETFRSDDQPLVAVAPIVKMIAPPRVFARPSHGSAVASARAK